MSYDPAVDPPPESGMFPSAISIYIDVYNALDDGFSGYGSNTYDFDTEDGALTDALARVHYRGTVGPGPVGNDAASGNPGTFPAFAVIGTDVDVSTGQRKYRCSAQRLVFRFYSYSGSCKVQIDWTEVLRYQIDGGAFATVASTAQSWTQPPGDFDAASLFDPGTFNIDDPTTWPGSDDFANVVATVPPSAAYSNIKNVELYVRAFGPSCVYGYTAPQDGSASLNGIPEPDPNA